MSTTLRVALSQTAPVWLDREKTLDRVLQCMKEASEQGAELIAFGEALVPGYPFWLDKLGGAAFDSPMHKDIHARYLQEGVSIESGDLSRICEAAQTMKMAVYLGVMERPIDRAGHTLYCSLVYINANGDIGSVHRKLMPTYEERLAWGIGDGHGLRVHDLAGFRVGGLNCWENWMPLARATMYAQGENLHVAVWPGNKRNTEDLTRVIAKESRSFVMSVSGLFTPEDIPDDFPYADQMRTETKETLANGGTCLSGPDGEWLLEPQVGESGTWVVEIDLLRVLEARQNFDPSGHYSRPDVFQLHVNQSRQQIIRFDTDSDS